MSGIKIKRTSLVNDGDKGDFWGGACVCREHFGGGAYSCHNANTL
jgi:hypothetical protein